MILFFGARGKDYFVVETGKKLGQKDLQKLEWLFETQQNETETIEGIFVGPRIETVSPWSTNVVEVINNMNLSDIKRVEKYTKIDSKNHSRHDPMTECVIENLTQNIFVLEIQKEPILSIDNIADYRKKEGLALTDDEVDYLESVAKKIGRNLTDSEIFGFTQVNSEHCRHKIFNGDFIIDGVKQPKTLFEHIKKTTKETPGLVVSAYKDNVAFIDGPKSVQFSPKDPTKPSYFSESDFESVISLKAETHNFPTTVEPFNGAATGSGGEIRDRMAGGIGSIPLAGTAVYMTSYPRFGRSFENLTKPRDWLYQSPEDILIKASNGASDFGNKFGQPLICGSLLTFENTQDGNVTGFDKVIMQAGGIGFGKKDQAFKAKPKKGDLIVVLGGDNYRIGLGGGAVSSVGGGELENTVVLNAVQRANPEMQKRVSNTIRAFVEMTTNPIISLHDHGAGGHLNCLSELVEEVGGEVYIDKLPIGDLTLSAKEIIGNESQERMGLIVDPRDINMLTEIAQRERSPIYVCGQVTGDMRLTFVDRETGDKPIDWELGDMFGNPPKTILEDNATTTEYDELEFDQKNLEKYLESVLQLEAVSNKDWLTNKVDRCVTGKVAKQQTCGELQLPLNNLGAMTIDYSSQKGIATSIGHAPAAGLIDSANGSKLSVVKSLTNLVWAPLTGGLGTVSLSANWMWPAKNPSQNARLYRAVESLGDFCVELGVNIPTGKDSLSMKQTYDDGQVVLSPGSVIISACSEISDVSKVIEPGIDTSIDSLIYYIDITKSDFELGGSSFAQVLGGVGSKSCTVDNPEYVAKTFKTVQKLIKNNLIAAGHDVSAGGLITTLLEMCFANQNGGLDIDLTEINSDIINTLFSEKPGLVVQVEKKHTNSFTDILKTSSIDFYEIGGTSNSRELQITSGKELHKLDIDFYRNIWNKTSHNFDTLQTNREQANIRQSNLGTQPLKFAFPKEYISKRADLPKIENKPKAGIIREKGINGDREMAYGLYMAGFDVKDIHMTDLISGREDLSELNMIVFTGGFSNSDVLGSAKGWAGSFLYNDKAKKALDKFYSRPDTLSLGVCNGCQLMMELGLIEPEYKENHLKMDHNDSQKFECGFVNVDIPKTNSIILSSLSGSRLGIWVAHGEGKFNLANESDYDIAIKYSYPDYPANPNGSEFSAAGLVSKDGRHLAMMPHIERSLFSWNWANYPKTNNQDQITPWAMAFVAAREWIEKST